MDREILKADLQYRKKVLWILLGIIVGGLLIMFIGYPYLRNYLLTLNCVRQAQILMPIFIILFFIPCLFGIYFLKISVRAHKESRFPPEGMKVIKDTPVFRDSAAKNVSAVLIFLAVFIILLCILSMVLSLIILMRFL